MARIPGPPGGGGSDLIVFPIDHMRETAAKILVLASNTQAQHDTLWQQIQNYVQDFNPDWQPTVVECLKPYADRLRSTYDWQMNLASALFDAIDALEGNEDNTSQAFTPRTAGPR